MVNLVVSLLATSALLAMFMSHPVSITITIILQTLMSSLVVALLYQTPWFSYILFLVFLGGMLILFSYITSLTPNFIFKPNTLWLATPPAVAVAFTLMYMKPHTHSSPQTPQLMINKLFYQDAATTTILALFLLVVLLIAVKITATHQGPLQTKT